LEGVYVLSSLRIKFVRGDEVKYISHLDLMKVFERALRRSEIPVSYSQGFNPHPGMVFGLPLSVGVTSEAEYADFELDEAVEPIEFLKRLNVQLPKGLIVIDAKEKLTKANIMASIARASYDVLVSFPGELGLDKLRIKIKQFMQQPVIMVEKQTKRGKKDVDIRPMIYKIDVNEVNEPLDGCCDDENLCWISLRLSAGSAANLKPELLLAALSDAAEINVKVRKIHRTGLFIEEAGKVLDPLDACG
jgi:radical SAM-linked protein